MQTIHQEILVVNDVGIGPAAVTSTATGTSVDALDYDELLAFIRFGAITGTSVVGTLKLQDSPDNSTWTDVTGAGFTAVSETSDNTFQFARVNAQGLNRYVRLVLTVAGTNPSITCYGGIILGSPRSKPVAGHGSAQFNLNPAVTS